MTTQAPDLQLMVLGEFAMVRDVLEEWRAHTERSVEVTWLESGEEFNAQKLNSHQIIVTDTDALGLGIGEVVNRAKSGPAQVPVVLIAGREETDQIAEAMELGLDEYVVGSGAGEKALLVQVLRRVSSGRRDLPRVGDTVARPHFWGFVESSPIPVKILDEKGTLRHVNPAVTSFLEYERNEMEGRPIFDFMHPEEVEEAKEAYKEVLTETRSIPSRGMEYGHHCLADRRYVRNTDSEEERIRWGNLYLMPLWRADGSLVHVVGLMVDITERKKAGLELKAIEEHQGAILDTTADGIVTIDTGGDIETVNSAGEEIFGYDADEVQGSSIDRLLQLEQNEESIWEVLKSLATSSETRQVEGIKADGERTPLEISVGEMSIHGQDKYTVVVRDVSERMNFQERIRRSERMEAIGQFAAGIAHDFNNVLTIINTNSHLLSDQQLVKEGVGEQCLTKIFDATERATRLTRHLLSLSPASMGEERRVDINEVIDELKSLFGSIVEEDIDLELKLADALAPVWADVSRLEQIILNLLVNARDAMSHGGKLTIETCNICAQTDSKDVPRELDPGDYILFEIRDTGTGIPDEIRDQIFDPYFSTKDPGTGLGLATVYSIVESMGGTVDVQSKMGKGTLFSVYLPVADTDAESEPAPREPTTDGRQKKEDREEKAILVVEDEQDIRQSVVMLLESEDYQVLEAADGEQAQELIEDYSGPIDVLLTDMIMPGLNGMEVAEIFCEKYPQAGVIFVSGYAGDVLKRKDMSPGQVHLTKPYDIRELKETIREVLE